VVFFLNLIIDHYGRCCKFATYQIDPKLTIMPAVADLKNTNISIYLLRKREIDNLNIIYHLTFILLKGKNIHKTFLYIQLYKFRH